MFLSILLLLPASALAQQQACSRGKAGEHNPHCVEASDRPASAMPEPSAALAFGLGALLVGAATRRRS
jgi:hypothetical protein